MLSNICVIKLTEAHQDAILFAVRLQPLCIGYEVFLHDLHFRELFLLQHGLMFFNPCIYPEITGIVEFVRWVF